ncbi:MAG TPA: UDP-glucuronic acid decarboxylase family protein [Candidatus Sulfotelmatobacter sp.]|nr:UDP-glucuronic acid decarboxylase family protein [Candidatus Sulfotelmatobacter sp.]
MQTALVAGGAGFIGSHLCKNLLDKNFKVICVDSLITGDKKNIEKHLSNKNFVFLEKDITTSLEIDDEVNYVFHLASPASPNKNSPRSYINYPIETLLANSQGTKNLLDLAKNKNSRFLYASSSEIYGDPAISPQAEDYFGNVNPNGVRSVYDEGKRFGEAISMAYFRKFGLDIRIIRIFNTYGPFMLKDDGRVISNFINQAINNKPLTIYGEGKQTRSFCFVSDMVEAVMLAMFSDNTKGEVLNLGNSNEKTISEIAEKIIKMTNSKSPVIYEKLPEDDPKVRKPDISKAKQLLNWEPKISLDDGLLKTIEYFKAL